MGPHFLREGAGGGRDCGEAWAAAGGLGVAGGGAVLRVEAAAATGVGALSRRAARQLPG